MTTPSTRAQLTIEGERGLRVERIFNASPRRVWDAFTKPELVAQWWGRGNQLDVERLDVERGGHWRFVEHHDGGVDGFEGRFREVTPPAYISYTFEWDGMPGHVIIEDVTLEDLGDARTKIVNVSLFFSQEERDGMISSGMEEGMNQSYEALDRLLATLA